MCCTYCIISLAQEHQTLKDNLYKCYNLWQKENGSIIVSTNNVLYGRIFSVFLFQNDEFVIVIIKKGIMYKRVDFCDGIGVTVSQKFVLSYVENGHFTQNYFIYLNMWL